MSPQVNVSGGKLNMPLGSLHDLALCQKLQEGSIYSLLWLNVLWGKWAPRGAQI